MLSSCQCKQVSNKLPIATIQKHKSYIISYVDADGYKQTLQFNDYVSFFAIVELLNAAHRQFTYDIIDTSYVTMR